MSEWSIGLMALVCVYAGALLGLGLQRLPPAHHLSPESKDAVKLVAGLLATLSALVLGLLIASAKGSFDSISDALRQASAKVIHDCGGNAILMDGPWSVTGHEISIFTLCTQKAYPNSATRRVSGWSFRAEASARDRPAHRLNDHVDRVRPGFLDLRCVPLTENSTCRLEKRLAKGRVVLGRDTVAVMSPSEIS